MLMLPCSRTNSRRRVLVAFAIVVCTILLASIGCKRPPHSPPALPQYPPPPPLCTGALNGGTWVVTITPNDKTSGVSYDIQYFQSGTTNPVGKYPYEDPDNSKGDFHVCPYTLDAKHPGDTVEWKVSKQSDSLAVTFRPEGHNNAPILYNNTVRVWAYQGTGTTGTVHTNPNPDPKSNNQYYYEYWVTVIDPDTHLTYVGDPGMKSGGSM